MQTLLTGVATSGSGVSVIVDALADVFAAGVVTPTSRHIGAQLTPTSLVNNAEEAVRLIAGIVEERQSLAAADQKHKIQMKHTSTIYIGQHLTKTVNNNRLTEEI